jgi:hypothetical protein
MKKKLVLKALTDPKFRKSLQENPEGALTPGELAGIKGGVTELMEMVDQINQQSQKVSDMLFCIVFDDDEVYA